jgi:hypothetical protein
MAYRQKETRKNCLIIFTWKKITFANGGRRSFSMEMKSSDEFGQHLEPHEPLNLIGFPSWIKIVRKVGTIKRKNDVQ